MNKLNYINIKLYKFQLNKLLIFLNNLKNIIKKIVQKLDKIRMLK
jgi:hypothetical protein